MPKFKFDSNGNFENVEAAKPFTVYDGPIPPRGVYRFVVKHPTLEWNSSDNEMVKFIAEISEPKGSDKAKYNGAVAFYNFTVGGPNVEKSAPYINAMLDAFGISRSKFWAGGLVTESDDLPTPIKRLGGKAFEGLVFHAATKIDRSWPKVNPEPKLAIASFLLPTGSSADEEDDEEEPEEAVVDTSAAKRAKKRPAKAVKPTDVDDEDDEDDTNGEETDANEDDEDDEDESDPDF